jgi:uncharacterized membrane protein YkoI
MIRSRLPFLAFLALATPILGAHAARAADGAPECLTEAEVRDVVNNRIVIPQIQALRLARSTTGGDAIRASLCRVDDGFIYIITMLARDGKLERVRIKGETGEPLPANKE